MGGGSLIHVSPSVFFQVVLGQRLRLTFRPSIYFSHQNGLRSKCGVHVDNRAGGGDSGWTYSCGPMLTFFNNVRGYSGGGGGAGAAKRKPELLRPPETSILK